MFLEKKRNPLVPPYYIQETLSGRIMIPHPNKFLFPGECHGDPPDKEIQKFLKFLKAKAPEVTDALKLKHTEA